MSDKCFQDLYEEINQVRVADCSVKSLPDLLHGYLSMYAMVRVCPGLEPAYGTSREIHGKLREIAGRLSHVVKDETLAWDERVGYVVDLMDAYQVYSDMEFLDVALDVAYQVLSLKGSEEIVLPGRTPNVCRLLCNCYYFTGDKACAALATGIAEEGMVGLHANGEKVHGRCVWTWCRTLKFYENTLGDGTGKTRELERLEREVYAWVETQMDEGADDLDSRAWCFNVWASREYELKLRE